MKIIWKILIRFSWINTSLQDLKFKAELSHILFIFSTYFTLPHYESTVQLHPSMSQMWNWGMFLLHQIISLGMKKVFCLWTLTLVRAVVICSIYLQSILINSVKWVSGLMTAKVFEKIYFEVPRVWKFHVVLKDKMCLLKGSVT